MGRKENPRFRNARTGEKADSHRSGTGGPEQTGITISKKQLILIIVITVVVILAAVSIPVYKSYIEPFNQTVIQVDDTEIDMRYFLERTRISGSDPSAMLYTLTQELLISEVAPQYGITVTEDDVDEYLKLQAGGGEGDISDLEYQEWLRQYLNTSQMSEEMLREIVEANLLYSRLEAYLAENLVRTREQVYLNIIVMLDYDEAVAAVSRIKEGEAFADIARELSVDESTRENGGAFDWIVPELSILDAYISRMSINQVSSPIPYYYSTGSTTTTDTSETPDFYYIIMISDVDSEREVDDDTYAQLQAIVMEDWLNAEFDQHDISYNFGSETLAWVNWQLQKNE